MLPSRAVVERVDAPLDAHVHVSSCVWEGQIQEHSCTGAPDPSRARAEDLRI